MEPGSRMWPGTVVSTETGPVFIDRDAVVRPGSFVEGPCYIGPGTVVEGAKVRPGCSFGPECRIGGEVQASIFQGYANKSHEGFIGHAFVGEWVNLGALTTNSDLKNAYQPVQVTWQGKTIDTDLLKVGCFIGDHAKTAIRSLINTGARIGTFANWFEPGLSPKEIPAFAWGNKAKWPLGHVLSNARRVMSRRGITPSPAYEQALRALYSRCVKSENRDSPSKREDARYSPRFRGHVPRSTLGLTGFGASGHLVLKTVQYQYPKTRVYVFARSEEEQTFARELGATWAGDTNDKPPELLDAIIDTMPAWTPVVAALSSLKPGGRLVINAIRKEEADKQVLLGLDYAKHLWMEKEIKSVANVTRMDVSEFLALAAKIPIKPEVQEYRLEDANQALLELKQRRIRGAKVLRI